MLEKLTVAAFRDGLDRLKQHGVLSPTLEQDLSRLADTVEKVSNWENGERYLRNAKVTSITAAGPMSKVFRLLACTMESLGKCVVDFAGRGWSVETMALVDAVSGCSTYTGRVLVEARTRPAQTETILDGPFVWDCAAHGLPQERAARELGYRCIVDFPEVRLP